LEDHRSGRVCGWHPLAELSARLERTAHRESGRHAREEVGFLERCPRQGFAQHASKGRDAGGAPGGEREVDLLRGQAGCRDRQLNASMCRTDLRVNRKRPVTEALLVIGAARQVPREGLWPGRGVQARRATPPVRLISAVRADGGHVVGRVGRWPMRPACCTGAPQRRATPHAVTGAPPRGRVAIGVGAPAAAPQRGTLGCIERVIWGRAAREGLQGEGVPQDNGEGRNPSQRLAVQSIPSQWRG
jgi:hypothetical protein